MYSRLWIVQMFKQAIEYICIRLVFPAVASSIGYSFKIIFIHPSIQSFIYSFIHTSIHPSILIYLFSHSCIHLFNFICSLSHPLIYSLICRDKVLNGESCGPGAEASNILLLTIINPLHPINVVSIELITSCLFQWVSIALSINCDHGAHSFLGSGVQLLFSGAIKAVAYAPSGFYSQGLWLKLFSTKRRLTLPPPKRCIFHHSSRITIMVICNWNSQDKFNFFRKKQDQMFQ